MIKPHSKNILNKTEKGCFILIDIEKKNLGIIKKISEEFHSIFGKSIGIGSHLSQIIPPLMRDTHYNLLKNYLNNIASTENSANHIPFILGID